MRIFILVVLFFSHSAVFAKVYYVNSEDSLKSVVMLLKPGDEVKIADGNYTPWKINISSHGTPSDPILIRAANSGKVTFTGDLTGPVFLLTGSYITVSGFVFSGIYQRKNGGSGIVAELRSSTGCRVTNCRFINVTATAQNIPIVAVSGNGSYNRIDHCFFSMNTDNQEMQVRITKDAVPVHTLIDHNEFRDKKKVSWKNGNGGECVQVGQDPINLGTIYSYTVVRENLFVACNGEPEVISNKSSGNYYISNRLTGCDGEIVMRGGHDCRIDSNTVSGGAGGIRVNGSGHTINGNILTRLPTGIRFMYGMSKGKTDIGFYVAAGDCSVDKNIITECVTGIYIGGSKNADWTGKFDTIRYPSRTRQDVAPYNIMIGSNRITKTETPVFRDN
jgi:poly(beta-D-mannuronate) lyase